MCAWRHAVNQYYLKAWCVVRRPKLVLVKYTKAYACKVPIYPLTDPNDYLASEIIHAPTHVQVDVSGRPHTCHARACSASCHSPH